MRVLYISPEYPNAGQTAAQVRANQLLPRLSSRLDLYVLGFTRKPSHSPNGALDVVIPLRSPVQLFFATFSDKPRAFMRFGHRLANDTLVERIDRFKPDIIHFDSIGTLGLLPAVSGGAKLVFHPHDSVTQLMKRSVAGESRLLRKFDKWLQYLKIRQVESGTYSRADLILVDTQEDADFISGLNKQNKSQVLPLGFDESVYSTKGTIEDIPVRSIVFSGSMSSDQSAEAAQFLVREIMPAVWKNNTDIVVYLVGANPCPQVMALANDGPGKVIVTGFVDDLAAYLRATAVYVAPLRLGSGMRTRVVEAAACGCAIVATPDAVLGLGGEEGMAEEHPWLVANTATEFAEAIEKLLSDPVLREDVKTKAAEYVAKKFTWDAVAENLVDKYKAILGGAND